MPLETSSRIAPSEDKRGYVLDATLREIMELGGGSETFLWSIIIQPKDSISFDFRFIEFGALRGGKPISSQAVKGACSGVAGGPVSG